MDLYQWMQYLAFAAAHAGVIAIAWSFWAWSSPARPGAFLGDTQAVVRAFALLAILCALLAFAAGVRLFGITVVLETLRTNANWVLRAMLTTSVAASGLGIVAGRQQQREREKAERARDEAERARAMAASAPPQEQEPRTAIYHRRSRCAICNMEAASPRGADLSHADLQGADLRGADLIGADLSGADLRGADLESAGQAVAAELARLWGSWTVVGLLLFGVMPLVNGSSSRELSHLLQITVIIGLVLTVMMLAHWREVRRWGANLRGANLEAADLRGADLRGALLTGARYDGSTRWPAGFDPEAHDAVRLG